MGFNWFIWISFFLDFQGFRDMGASGLKSQPAAPIEPFARLQVGFLSSEVFHYNL